MTQNYLIEPVKNIQELIDSILKTKGLAFEYLAIAIGVKSEDLKRWYQGIECPTSNAMRDLCLIFCEVSIEHYHLRH